MWMPPKNPNPHTGGARPSNGFGGQPGAATGPYSPDVLPPHAAPDGAISSTGLGFGPTGGAIAVDPRGNSQPYGLEHNVNSYRDNPGGVTGVTQGNQGGFSGNTEHFLTGNAARNLMANAMPKPRTAYGDLPPPPQPSHQPVAPSSGPYANTGGPRPNGPNEVNPYQPPANPNQAPRPIRPAYNNPYGGGGFNSPFSNAGGFGGGGFNPFGGGGFSPYGGSPFGGGYNPYGGGFGPRFNNMGGGFGGGYNPFSGGGGMMNNTDQRSQMLQNLLRMFG